MTKRKLTFWVLAVTGAYGAAMSTVIDEIRGAFKNIGEGSNRRGLYPFEEIKGIQRSVSSLGFGAAFNPAAAACAREEILAQWKRVQEPFLSEFDQEEPTYPSSPHLDNSERAV